MSDTRVPVVVYGATGFTGALICEELERQAIPFAIGGRDEQKLRALAARLPSHPRFFLADLADGAGLRTFAEAGKVVLSCAGPFARFGKPVQDAALQAGAHWLDVTGEYAFVLATRTRDSEARRSGVAMINAVGLDIIPSDAVAAAAAGQLPDVEWLRVAVATRGPVTRGTLRSMVDIAAEGGLAFLDETLTPEPPGAERWTAHFPAPFGDQACVSLPLADVVAAPASTGALNVRSFGVAPFWAGPALRLAPWLQKLAGMKPVRSVIDQRIESLEGPSQNSREKGRFAVYAEARAVDGRVATAWAVGGDAYDFTAAAAVHCAKLASAKGFEKSGALTPTQAFGARPLLDGLASAGLRWGFGVP